MSHDNPLERHASPDEVGEAVNSLTPEEMVRLRKRAEYQLFGTEFQDPMELLGEAVKRAMVATSPDKRENERGRPWPMERVKFAAFLAMSMDSIADASRESCEQVSTARLEALAGEDGNVETVLHAAGYSHPDPLEQVLDVEERRARYSAAKADADAIEALFVGDQPVLAIIEGEKEGMPAREVREMFELDEKTYDSARRRMRRKVDKFMPNGRTP